jgi:uncharacterized membrane-anchored protein YhcB (DUF1043 family)
MIALIAILIIGVIIMYTYVEMDRQEIQKRQEQIQRDLDSLKASIKEEERKRHEEFMNKPYEGGV